MIGGKKIAEGGYGCVFHPEINCKAKETTNKKFISKLQFLDFSARNEIAIGSYLNSKFNNDKEHPLLNNFAPVVSSCNVDKSKFKKNILNQCKVLQKVSTENDISIIKIRYIDMDIFDKFLLNNIDSASIMLTLVSSYNHLLKSLKKLILIDVVHFDLKGPNIVFDKKLNLPIIIDFGLSFKMSDLNSQTLFNYFYVYAPQYYIWPLEVHYMNFLLHINESPSDSELKEIANDFSENNSALYGFSDNFIKLYKNYCYKVLKIYNKLPLTDRKKIILQAWKTWDNYSLSVMFLKIINTFINNDNTYLKNIDFYKKFIKLLLINIHPNFKKRRSLEYSMNYFNEIIKNQKNNIETLSNFYTSEQNLNKIKVNIVNDVVKDTKINDLVERSTY